MAPSRDRAGRRHAGWRAVRLATCQAARVCVARTRTSSARERTSQPGTHLEGSREGAAPAAPARGLAEEVGFEPTVPCRTHDFQSCRFGRSRTPPGARRQAPAPPGAEHRGCRRSCARVAGPVGRPVTLSFRGTAAVRSLPEDRRCGPAVAPASAAAGFCATRHREPSQGRKAAALSGSPRVPQATWPLRPRAGRLRKSRERAGRSPEDRRRLPSDRVRVRRIHGRRVAAR